MPAFHTELLCEARLPTSHPTQLTTSSVSLWMVWAPPHFHTSLLSQLEASEGQASDLSLTLLCSEQS